jgi:hypothetical protein
MGGAGSATEESDGLTVCAEAPTGNMTLDTTTRLMALTASDRTAWLDMPSSFRFGVPRA